MKKSLLLLSLTTLSFTAFSQNGTPANVEPPVEKNCYQKWADLFEERGVYAIEDSLYENVVVTIRKSEMAECYYGRVRVIEGKVNRIQIKYEDGTFVDLEKQFRHTKPVGITNGISTSRVTMDDEIVNVLFVMKIKPKKKQFAKAPDPDDFK